MFIAKRDDIDSLIESKVGISEQFNIIDRNIDLLKNMIEKSSSKIDKDAEKKAKS